MGTGPVVENNPLRQDVGQNLKNKILSTGEKVDQCFIVALMTDARSHLNKVGVFFYNVIERTHPAKSREEINTEWLGSLSRCNAKLEEIAQMMQNDELSLNEALMISHSLYFSTLKQISSQCPGLLTVPDNEILPGCTKCKEQLQKFQSEEQSGAAKMEEANKDAVQRVFERID